MDKCEKAFKKYFFHNFTLKIIIAHIWALAIFVLMFCILLKLPKSVMGLNDFSTEQEILYATNSVAIISTFIVILFSIATLFFIVITFSRFQFYHHRLLVYFLFVFTSLGIITLLVLVAIKNCLETPDSTVANICVPAFFIILISFIYITLMVAYINDRYSTEYIVWSCINEK